MKEIQDCCKRCLTFIKNSEVKTLHSEKRYNLLCKKCSSKGLERRNKKLVKFNRTLKQRKIVSKRMSKNNPMKSLECREKVSKSIKSLYDLGILISPFTNPKNREHGSMSLEARKRLSTNMKIRNPMFNEKVVTKSVKNREGTVFPKGEKHGNWKGNRDRSQTIRTWLYGDWVFPILERDGFECVMCGVGKCRLEVHHLIPFSKILKSVLKTRKLNKLSYEEFLIVAKRVISIHIKRVNGLTVCEECHKLLDKKRR